VTWLVAASWQGALVALVAILAEVLRVRPGLRYALWLAFAVRLLLPPALESPVGVAPGAAAPEGLPLLPVWLIGVAAGACLVLLRVRRARRALLRGAEPFGGKLPRRAAERLGLRRVPRVLVGGCGPAVFGVLRPTVVLPRALVRAFDEGSIEHVLLHEFAHVKRRDLLAQLLFGALNVVYWFHPLVWVARRRAYAARELACDATVARVVGSAAAYRRTLLCAALLCAPAGAGAAGLSGAFMSRIRALEREPKPARGWRRLATFALALLLVAVAAPAPFDEAAALRAQVSRMIANPEAHGCLETQFAFLRAVALELKD
jgi:beta-lactamase regulating signal transducer with metallopeptidase domain